MPKRQYGLFTINLIGLAALSFGMLFRPLAETLFRQITSGAVINAHAEELLTARNADLDPHTRQQRRPG